MGCLCAIKIYALLVHADRIESMILSLEELEETPLSRSLGVQGELLMEKSIKNCHFLLHFRPLIILSILHWLIRPLLLFVMNNEKSTIIHVKVFWSYDTITGWIVLYLMQLIHVATAIIGLIIFDSLILCIAEMILAECSVLILALNRIKFNKISKKVDIIKEDVQTLTIETYIEFHKKILSIIEVFKEVTDNTQIIQVLILTIVFCLSIFEASSMRGVTLNKVLNLIELTSSFILIIFMYCHYSSAITEACLDIGRAAYMNNWYEASIYDRKCLLMIVQRSRKKQIFGKYLDVDFNTFTNILKTAFSYYNVLKAIDIN
ncbi:hypothetical protein O3M35_013097 [Rhynocoris fuscipes]|uniref:Odorant receptor n=1 Tax=Rhynocoris fuscipes TaxID=488301 RepID=A0AAW1CK80_9HEMI